MARNYNTNRDGSTFDEDAVEAIWGKGQINLKYRGFRKDKCGASIQRTKYGETKQWGWEIDHIKPVARGGTDNMNNLRPLQWENNRHKGDDYPNWSCKVRN